MAKQMKAKDFFGNEIAVTIEKGIDSSGNVRIQLWDEDGPFATLTRDMGEKLPEGCAYVDTNNFPDAERFIKKYNLGFHKGKFLFSGYCRYPLYKFF